MYTEHCNKMRMNYFPCCKPFSRFHLFFSFFFLFHLHPAKRDVQEPHTVNKGENYISVSLLQINTTHCLPSVEARVFALESALGDPDSGPAQIHCVLFLYDTILSQCLPPSRCIIYWVPKNFMLGENLVMD